MKKLILLFSACLALGHTVRLNAQTTCATAVTVTPGTYTAPALTGTGASHAPATASAWYSFTPASTGTLNISSCGGGSDTRLWVMSGTCGALVAVADNDDATGCISTGTDEYASRLTNVSLTGGVTYYFEWDNRWDNTGFTWSFTFTSFPNNGDGAVTKVMNEYTRKPISQLTGGIVLGGTLQNLSSTPLTNMVLRSDVYLAGNMVTPVATFSSTPVTLASGASQNVTSGTWNPPANVADYVIVYTKTQTETDAVPGNNSITQNFSADYNFYARDNNVLAGGLGTAAGGVRQGSQFTVTANDQITAVQYNLRNTSATQQYTIEIYRVTGGVMGATALYTSPSQTTTGTPGFITLNITPLNVTPGEYAVVLNHTNTTGAVNISLGYSNNIYTPLKQWIRIGTGAWDHPENVGFQLAYMIRPKFGTDAANDVRFVSNSNPNEYTAVHARQAPAGTPLNFQAVGRNGGTAAATNVKLTVNVKNSANTVVYTAASATQNLATATNGTFTVAPYTVTAADTYTIEYVFSADGTDQIPNNNTGINTFTRSSNFMSRAAGITGSLGIGPNATPGVYDNAVLGQTYTLTAADELKSVRFVLNAPPANVPVRVDIYNTNGTGVPTGTPIASTTSYTTTPADNANGVTLDLPITTGNLSLAAGTYYLGVIEQEDNITLATSPQNFTAGKVFIKWDGNAGGAWTTSESFNFNIAFVLNPVFNVCVPVTTTFNVSNANCSAADGSAEVIATGGTGTLTYLWSNGQTTSTLTNVTSGVYSVTITDDNACTTTAQVTVQDQSTLTATANVTNVLCRNGNTGSVTLLPTGGEAPYTYVWTGSANTTATLSNLVAGTYSATITDDNGCTFIVTENVTQPATSVAATTTAVNVACFGGSNGSVTVTATGGTAPYTYSWAGSANTTATLPNVAAGTFTVTVTDNNGCTFDVSQTVTQPGSAPSVTGVVNNNTGGINITATGGTAPYTYSWSNGTTTEDQTGLADGTYTVTVTDAHGCTTTGTYTILHPFGINEALGLGELKIFPNPSNGQFNVSIQTLENKDITVDLINAVGKTMMSVKADNVSSHVFSFDVQGYAAGMYAVRISANGKSITKTIIIQ